MRRIYFAAFVSLVLGLILTKLQIRLSKKFGFIDVPKDQRRMHTDSIPTCGGFAMYFAIFIPYMILYKFTPRNTAIFIGATIIMLSGFYDDMHDLKPKYKVLFQLLAGLVVYFLGNIRIMNIGNPFIDNNLLSLGYLSLPATLFWIVAVTNIINLIDGLDGLAGGVVFISSMTLAVVSVSYEQYSLTALCLCVGFSYLAFLKYNFAPAKIFMGDTGALLAGFMLAVITIQGAMKAVAAIGIIVPIMILGLPVFDTTFAMIRRLLSGRSIASADKGHLHHRLLRKYSTKKTVLILYTISAIFSVFGILVMKLRNTVSVLISGIIFMIIVFLAYKIGLFKDGEN